MGILDKMAKENDFRNSLECIDCQKPKQYISTGSYALNGILSGNVYNGILDDTIVALVGPSNSGKSFVLAHIAREAIRAGFEVLLFDSERAVRKEFYESIGCDTSKIFRIPVGTVSKLKIDAFKTIQNYYEKAGEKDKLFVGIDSIGNLATLKEINDVESGKDKSDQGASAKDKNSAFRIISSMATEYNFPLVFTNHTYAAIGDLFAQREKIAGGAKSIYNSHIIVYFQRLVNKEESKDALGKTKKKHVGIKIKTTTLKNRNFPEEQTAYLDLRYDTGLNPYSGLLQFAIYAGVLQNKPKGYLVTATGKTVYDKNLYTPEIFDEKALNKINEWLNTQGYSSLSDIFSDAVSEKLLEAEGDGKDEQTERK